MASELRTQADLAKIRAQELMDTNNSAASDVSDKLLSILEAGESSGIARELLDHYLHDYLKIRVTNSRLANSFEYSRVKFRQLSGIKEKISEIVGILYANKGMDQTPVIPNQSTKPIDDSEKTGKDRFKDIREQVINDLEKNIIENREFNESRILRNSALNRFEAKLSDSEAIKLNTIGEKLKKICTGNRLDALAETIHAGQESHAQMIWKFSELIKQLSSLGVSIDDKLVKDFEPLNEKLKPIKDLDKHYKHLTKTINMVHRIAQLGYHSMISRKQKEKLDKVLSRLDMSKEVNDELTKFNQIESFDSNTEHGFLDELVKKITNLPKFNEIITSMTMTKAQFNEWFYSSCAFTLTNVAKNNLHHQKVIVFGDRVKEFEADTQSRRGMMRRKIFAIADRMGTSANFGSTKDRDLANSYFNKFKDLFYAKEEDNFTDMLPNTKTPTNLHFNKMEKVLSALIRSRSGQIVCGDRLRRGSSKRIIAKYIQEGLNGSNKSFWKWRQRGWHKGDDATILAMTIMSQNETTNKIFYQDEDRTQKADGRRKKLRGRASFIEQHWKNANENLKPKMDKAIAFTETAAIKGAQLSKWIAKGVNKVGSKTTKVVTKNVGVGLEKFNKEMEKKRYRLLKLPAYIPYLGTKLLAPIMKQGYKIASYTDANGNKHLDEAGNAIATGYDEVKNLAGKAMGQKPEYLGQAITKAGAKTLEFAAKGASDVGQRGYDLIQRGQDRSLLGALYKAAQREKELGDMMASGELSEILNLKLSGPRLFNEDGRVVTVTDNITDDQMRAGRDLSGEITSQLEDMQKGISDYEDMLSRKLEEAKDITEQNNLLNKKSQIENRKGDIINIRIDLEQLAPLLKDPGSKSTEISTLIGNNGPATGLKLKIQDLQNAAIARRGIINAPETAGLAAGATVNRERKADLQRDITAAQTEMNAQNAIIAANSGNTPAERIARTNAQIAVNAAESRKKQAEQRVYELNQELIELNSREGRLKKISSLITTIKDETDTMHLDKNTLKSITKSLDLILYKPTTIASEKKKTSGELAGALGEEK